MEKEFKNKIRAVAMMRDISIPRLAELAGMNYPNVARWAKNGNQPNLCDAYRLSEILECKVDDLVLKADDLG